MFCWSRIRIEFYMLQSKFIAAFRICQKIVCDMCTRGGGGMVDLTKILVIFGLNRVFFVVEW